MKALSTKAAPMSHNRRTGKTILLPFQSCSPVRTLTSKSIVGVTASYAVDAGLCACWAGFTVPVAAPKKNHQHAEDNALNNNL